MYKGCEKWHRWLQNYCQNQDPNLKTNLLLVKDWQNEVFLRFSVYLTNTCGHIGQTVKALRIFHKFTGLNTFHGYFHQVNYINYTKQSKLLYLTSSWLYQNSGITGIGGIMLTCFSIALFRLRNLVWDLIFQSKKFKEPLYMETL